MKINRGQSSGQQPPKSQPAPPPVPAAPPVRETPAPAERRIFENPYADPVKPQPDRRKKSGPRKKRGKLFWGLLILLLLLLFVIAVAAGYYISGSISTRQNLAADVSPALAEQLTDDAQASGYEEGVITRNGKKYRLNEDLVTILLLGVDNRAGVQPQQQWGDAGLADTILLAVMDKKDSEFSLISISRDTMTEINCYDAEGNLIGYAVDHLAVGYYYGDNAHGSCQAMAEDVSKLLYGIPINMYCAFSLESVPMINDAIGGVTVTIPAEYAAINAKYTAGQQVTLHGSEALSFIQSRDTELDGSNNGRMARQKQYAIAYISKAKAEMKNNFTLPLTIFNSVSGQLCTNIGADKVIYLASQVLSMQFSEDNIHSVQGTNQYGGEYDEFYVDQNALAELVLDTFYCEVTQ